MLAGTLLINCISNIKNAHSYPLSTFRIGTAQKSATHSHLLHLCALGMRIKRITAATNIVRSFIQLSSKLVLGFLAYWLLYCFPEHMPDDL